MAISTGEAIALTGAILGHANPRSTAINGHMQNDPSKRAANRVTKKIAAALFGRPPKSRKAESADQASSDMDSELINALAKRLAEDGPNAARLRAAITQVIARERRVRR